MGRYRIDISTDLAEISAREWDATVLAAGGSVFSSHGWLAAYTRAAPHESRPYFLLARRDGRLAGLLPAYLTRGCPRLEAHRKIVVSRETPLQEPMLLAHTLYSYYGGPLRTGDDPELLAALMGGFEALAEELEVEVYGVVNAVAADTRLQEWFRHRGYANRYLSSTMVLPIVWETFDDYLRDLPRKFRRTLRHAANKAQRDGLSAEYGAVASVAGEMVDLITGVFEKHRHAETHLFPASYLQAVAHEMGEQAKFLRVRAPGGELITVMLVLEQAGCLTPWVAGIDYTSLRRFGPYHFAYRYLIRHAIEGGFHQIDLGRGSYRLKQRYGCQRRALTLALSSPRRELWPEVDAWSEDLASHSLARYARHFAGREESEEHHAEGSDG